MSKYIYLGTNGNHLLYYNATKDEFYSAEPGYFDMEMDDDICILDEFPSPDQEAKEKAVLITNPYEIAALKSAYESIRIYEDKEKRLKRDIKVLSKKSQEEALEKEKRKKKAFYFSCIFMALIALQPQINSLVDDAGIKIENMIDDYRANHQNDEKHLDEFYKSVQKNTTMSDELKELFNSIFLTLVKSDAYLSDSQVRDICRRLEEFDFTYHNEKTYVYSLPYIIFGDNNYFNRLVTDALDESANNHEPTDLSMFGMLNVGVSDKLLTSIFTGGEEAYIKELAKIYNTTEDNIQELLYTINNYRHTANKDFKSSLKRKFNQNFGSILLDYYRDKEQGDYREIDYLILSSQIFDGDFTVNNNMFSDIITIHHKDATYGEYDLYYDSLTGEDISYRVYYEKLVELIKDKGNNLDYDDQDSRFLIYLVTLAYDDCWDYEIDEFINCKTAEDLAQKIINNIFYGRYSLVNINPSFLYSYFYNGQINLSDIISEINTPSNDALSLALFKEFDHCIRMDLNKKGLSHDEYNAKLTKIFNAIQKDNEDLYDLLMKSIIDDASLLSSLKLAPFEYTLTDNDIKKYNYRVDD